MRRENISVVGSAVQKHGGRKWSVIFEEQQTGQRAHRKKPNIRQLER